MVAMVDLNDRVKKFIKDDSYLAGANLQFAGMFSTLK